MNRLFYGLALSMGLGCNAPKEATDTTLDDMSVEDQRSLPFYGTWIMEEAQVSIIDPDGNMETIPTLINAGELTELEFFDPESGSIEVKFDMEITFMENDFGRGLRTVLVGEHEGVEQDTIKWWVDDEYLNIETSDRRIFTWYDFPEEDYMFLEFDRDNQMFVDASCMLQIWMRRVRGESAE